MIRAQKRLILAYLLFLLGLRLSGSVPPPLSSVFYILSYLLPAVFLLAFAGRNGVDLTVCPPKITGHSFLYSLPLFFPTVLLLFGISALTSLLFGAFGLQGNTALAGSPAEIFFSYLLLPALFEEFLFRYLPLSLLAPYGKKGAVLFGALCFSLTHCDFFQMPYAFVAGVIFAAVDLAAGSILPSVLFHFLNNALSVLLLRYGSEGYFSLLFFASLVLLSLVSGAFLLWKKSHYLALFFPQKEEKEKVIFTKSTISLILVCLLFAIFRLISQNP